MPATVERPHGSRKFSIDLQHRFDGHAGSAKQLANTRDIDASVHKRPDHLSQIGSAEQCRVQFGRYQVGAGLVMDERQHR